VADRILCSRVTCSLVHFDLGIAVSVGGHRRHCSVFPAAPNARLNPVLIDGIVSPELGLMIYLRCPSSSAWAIGTLVGVSMIISGVTRVTLSLAVRKATDMFSPFSSKLAA